MNKERTEYSRAWMEARRLRAWELLQKGWKQIEVAGALGVSRGAVSRWAALARQEGSQALRRRKPPGGPRKLKGEQLAQLPGLLQQGPCTFGFCGEIWTRARIAQVIRQEFGVSYHPTQVGRLLKECGFSWQKPALRASQRNEEAISDWRERRFPELKKRL